MIKLHPETAQAIANLITAIDSAGIMYAGECDTATYNYYLAKEFKAIIKLTENYGIPHVGYAQAVESMEKDRYANASLITAPL
tara:strand:- start:45 stop:293 length:249 start_codon:yes stop_codon:yes gene_type:complete